ncbi:MAG TPA: methyl-accepting chemotaxis protein [Candidatus Cybelea sp.]|nr:methyl-accepting chemotaxis protein [Candidatus Cybelea sp.]
MNIGKRFLIAGTIAILALTVVSALGIWGTNEAAKGTATVNVIAAAIRNQMEADMMHDALRADVLIALREGRLGNKAAQPQIAQATADDIKNLEDHIAANKALDLPAEDKAALDALGPALTDYVAGAKEIVNGAFTDNYGANQKFPAFGQKFDALEAKMGEAGDAVQHSADAIKADVERHAQNLLVTLGILIAISATALILVLAWTARSVVKPVKAMTAAMSGLAAGDITTEIPHRERKDEIGAMAGALEVLKENSARANHLAEDQNRAHETQRHRTEALERLCREFDAEMSRTLGEVGGSLQKMEDTVALMSRTAEQTAGEASHATEASSHTATSVGSVATAATELSSTINEISRQVAQSNKIAGEAAEQARQTNDQITGLATAAEKVGAIVQLINEIASQTNLLALNATIEAARAGEAGKGFAVVASEVKNLASQTAKATDEIASHVGAIQSETQRSVSAIQGVAKIIEEINHITGAVAAAVEEQGAATQEIARSVDQAAGGTREVSASITNVVGVAGQSRDAAAQLTEATRSLSTQSQALRGGVERFLANVKTV